MSGAPWSSHARGLVSASYLQQGEDALRKRQNLRKLPAQGWDDVSIEMLLQDLGGMDSNNFLSSAGMGEREARCASALVRRRHYGMLHGMGRSGNIAAEQPKAAGSTLATRIANFLVADAMREAGLPEVRQVTVLPVATGMALTLCLLATREQLRRSAPAPAAAPTQLPAGGPRFVIWPRIDQKTCVKCVQAAGLELLVVENQLEGDEVRTDVAGVEEELRRRERGSVVCVLSTTSCFAPRAPDRVEEIARLCLKYDVPHIINNAYGVQSAAICKLVTSAARKGRVDAIVQSTDKNFLVPVGGSVVASLASKGGGKPKAGPTVAGGEASACRPSLVEAVNRSYPGRASIGPLLDVLITLLSLGRSGWLRVLREREELFAYARQRVGDLARLHGERVLDTGSNPISLAISLASLERDGAPAESSDKDPGDTALPRGPIPQPGLTQGGAAGARQVPLPLAAANAAVPPVSEPERGDERWLRAESATGHGLPSAASQESPNRALTALGAMLFSRLVSGCRVVPKGVLESVGTLRLAGFGSSHTQYPVPYLTAAAALGGRREDVDLFVERLDGCLRELRKRQGGTPTSARV